jgi:outer membrane lipoprotein LolB
MRIARVNGHAGCLAMLAVVSLIGGGCTLRRPEPVPVDWSARHERLLSLDDWQAWGRIAFKAANGGGQGDLHWEQQRSATQVKVSGPFGAGAYDIRWDPQTLSITSRNGEFSRAYTGPDAANQFLSEQLGWSFPAASVRYWLLGVADPASPSAQRFAPDGQLAAIDQDGWMVQYERFTEHAGLPMPAKIVIESERARLRLIIDRWQF